MTEGINLTARFEELGEQQVRLLLSTSGLPQSSQLPAINWLTKKDQEAKLLREASHSEQIEIARLASSAAERAAVAAERASVAAERQAVAAERANTRATIALIIAIISITATVIGMIVVHFDTIRQMTHSG